MVGACAAICCGDSCCACFVHSFSVTSSRPDFCAAYTRHDSAPLWMLLRQLGGDGGRVLCIQPQYYFCVTLEVSTVVHRVVGCSLEKPVPRRLSPRRVARPPLRPPPRRTLCSPRAPAASASVVPSEYVGRYFAFNMLDTVCMLSPPAYITGRLPLCSCHCCLGLSPSSCWLLVSVGAYQLLIFCKWLVATKSELFR